MRILCAPLAAAVLCFAAPAAFGQRLVTEGDLMSGLLRGPAATPFDGMPYTQRYAMGLEPPQMFFANAGSRRLIEMDYADRFDRAVKFGYALPEEPVYPEPRPHRRGLGIFRR